jgi:hypothetical protein
VNETPADFGIEAPVTVITGGQRPIRIVNRCKARNSSGFDASKSTMTTVASPATKVASSVRTVPLTTVSSILAFDPKVERRVCSNSCPESAR